MPKTQAKKATVPRTPRKKVAVAAPPSPRPGWPGRLDALARAQQEGAKVFETLVKQGQRTKQTAAETAAVARDVATAKVKEMQQIAGGTWDKLEQVFEERVARALASLGIYTQSDMQRLSGRVDKLAEQVDQLLKARQGAARSPAERAKKTTGKV
jgi:poly(hydroxyalkanoate) granule-associated protein